MPHQCDFGVLNAHFIPCYFLSLSPHSSSYQTLCFIELLHICRSGDICVCEIACLLFSVIFSSMALAVAMLVCLLVGPSLCPG